MKAANSQPPAFAWEDWYAGVGHDRERIPEIDDYFNDMYQTYVPRFFGDVAKTQTQFVSPEEATRVLKDKATELGADLVGICELEITDLYQGREVNEQFAIAIGQKMLWRNFQTVPSKESALEQIRVYHGLTKLCAELAEFIRSLGYTCTVGHPVGDSDLLHVPIALKAGFGELGRHGSIINPTFGPLFRLGSIATSIPMTIDQPIDAGIAAFCDICKACRKFCPADAVPDKRDTNSGKDHLGNDRYRIDTGKCFPYFAKNNYCAICLPVCVYNHKDWARDFEGFQTKLFPDVIMNKPPAPYDDLPETRRHVYPKKNRAK